MAPPRPPLVLVVDDDRLYQEMITSAIEGIDCRVTAVDSAEEGIRIVGEQPVDVVITDQYLDGMTGLSFLKLLRERECPSKRILLSGHIDKETAIAAVNDAGVFRIIEKPFDRFAIRSAVFLALDALGRSPS